MLLSSLLRILVATGLVCAVKAQDGTLPTFFPETLGQDGPGRNGVPECDDPPLRTDRGITASQATCDTCPGGKSPVELQDSYADSGDPVLLHNGAVSYRATDLFIPGRGINFELTRRYNSKRINDPSVVGSGWEFAFDQKLTIAIDQSQTIPDTAHLQNGNNRIDSYFRIPGQSDFVGSAGLYTRIYEENGFWVLRARHGSRSYFEADPYKSSTYRLAMVQDAIGNSQVYEYYTLKETFAGKLKTVTESLGRDITFTYIQTSKGVRLERVTDFVGREVLYGYDAAGDLTSVRTPVVASTGGVNDFPNGRTEQYTYYSGSQAHLLHEVIRPSQVADGTLTPYVTFTYLSHASWWNGWVNTQTLGTGTISYYYHGNPPSAPPGVSVPISMKTRVTDRNGNNTNYWFSQGGHLVLKEEVDAGVGATFSTRFSYNDDGELTEVVRPRGNIETRTYHSTTSAPEDRFKAGNLATITRSRGSVSDFSLGYDSITVQYEWDPVFNQLISRTDPRNAAWKTEFVLDYMEGSVTPGDPNDVGPGIALQLGITATAARDLVAPFVKNADLNGDGKGGSSTGVTVQGMVIQRIEPTVNLDQSIGIDHQMIAEGDASQEAITTWTYNEYGQVTSQTDAEENVSLFAYTPSNDLDSNGLDDVTGSATLAATGGVPRRTIEDTSLPNTDDPQFSGLVPRALATDIGRNKGAGPNPAVRNRTTDIYHNLARRVVAYVDGRGVQYDLSVNELDEVWKVRTATDTSAATLRNGGAPEEPSEAHLAGAALSYEKRIVRDANGMIINVKSTDSVATPGNDGFWETQYEYDILDNLRYERVEKTGGQFVATETQYDANENVLRVISPLGNYTRYEYDARDLLAKTFFGSPLTEEQVEVRQYDGNQNIEVITDAKVQSTVYAYDGFDRVQHVTDRIGNEYTTKYDQASNAIDSLVSMKPNGSGSAAPLRRTVAAYDERSRPWRLDQNSETGTLADGMLAPGDGLVSGRFDYDRLSRQTAQTRDNGSAFKTQYDGMGRAVWSQDPKGNVTQGSFDDESNLVLVTETDTYPDAGHTRQFWRWNRYDALGRQITSTNQLGETDRASYDARGLITASSDAEAGGTAGQIHGVTVNSPGNSKSYTYDGRGLLLAEIMDLRAGGVGGGGLDGGTYNTDGQVTLQQEWDDDGRLRKRVDDNGNPTDYVLDHRGRVEFEEFADGTHIHLGYDANNNTTVRVDARGNHTQYQYDPLDRLLSAERIAGPSAFGTSKVAYVRDGLGRAESATSHYNPEGGATSTWTVTRTWDALDRPLTETQAGRTLTYEWKEESKRVQTLYPTATPAGTLTVGYSYDSLNRVSTIKTNLTDLAGYTYAGPDRKLSRSLRNRASTRWHDGAYDDSAYYDGAKRQTKLDHVNLLTLAQLGSFEHAYNRVGARLWERRVHDGGKGDNYVLDSLYRLTKFERRVPAADIGVIGQGGDESDRSWELDGVHNWRGFTVDATTSFNGVDSVHNYDSFAGVTPDYDLDGNLLKPDVTGTVDLSYDFLNRLVRVRNTASGESLEHIYDAEGRRVRTIFSNVVGAPLQRDYVYDGWEVIEEHDTVTNTDANGPPTIERLMRRYVMGIGIDEPVCMEILPGQEGARTVYFMQSTLGNVVGLTNNVGGVVERYTYDAYGAPRFEDVNSAPLAVQKSAYGNPYLFTGRRFEPWILPLYEYRNRFYLPEQGRFVQRDPIGMWGDSRTLGNSTTYCAARPVDGTDPHGLEVIVYTIEIHAENAIEQAGASSGIMHELIEVTDGKMSTTFAGHPASKGDGLEVRKNWDSPRDPKTGKVRKGYIGRVIPPPKGMSQAAWDSAVLRAGRRIMDLVNTAPGGPNAASPQPPGKTSTGDPKPAGPSTGPGSPGYFNPDQPRMPYVPWNGFPYNGYSPFGYNCWWTSREILRVAREDLKIKYGRWLRRYAN